MRRMEEIPCAAFADFVLPIHGCNFIVFLYNGIIRSLCGKTHNHIDHNGDDECGASAHRS